ncbi:phage head closure protein [Priestia megaterium]|uniref:phage head closure protein n=1 Tax=Priestia megaterium TaxID=1404 RepID=UPI003D2E1E81
MNPANFDRRITFQVSGQGVDSEGYPIEGWTDVKTVWAMIKTLTGKEVFQAMTTKTEKTTRFVIRYTTGIDEDMRILFGTRIFNIQSIINDDEQNKTMTIIGVEVI